VLVWRYAQESAGPQGAVSQIRGGAGVLTAALVSAAREAGAELYSSKRVSSIVVEKARATGVTLADGEMIAADAVLSSFDARETLLHLVPAGSGGFGMRASLAPASPTACAQILFALSSSPPFAGVDTDDLAGRISVIERSEVAEEAKGAAVTACLPREVAMEVMVPTIADLTLARGGSHVLSAIVPYLPASPEGGWVGAHELLRRRVLAHAEGFAPGLRDRVISCVLSHPIILRRAAAMPRCLPRPWRGCSPVMKRASVRRLRGCICAAERPSRWTPCRAERAVLRRAWLSCEPARVSRHERRAPADAVSYSHRMHNGRERMGAARAVSACRHILAIRIRRRLLRACRPF
jgi:hypothetical protein